MPNKNNAPARVPECHPDRKHWARGMCKKCYDLWYVKENREHLNERSRAWAKSNPEKIRATRWKYLYDIDVPTVHARLKAQDGLCKICQSKPAEHIDHNHETGQTRGLLCGDCNRALGLFREDPIRLARAVAYLEMWNNTYQQTRKARGNNDDD